MRKKEVKYKISKNNKYNFAVKREIRNQKETLTNKKKKPERDESM